MIEFIIPGEPRGKGRHQTVRLKNGKTGTYTPDKTVAYEELARQRFRQQWPSEELPFPDKTPVCVMITVCFSIPNSASKKARASMIDGRIRPTKKPDVDNVIKIVLDALNGFAWHDDAQVVDLSVSKIYTDQEPFVRVELASPDEYRLPF